MQKTFSVGELNKWRLNFTNHQQLPFITTSALISLKDLEDFVAAIKAQQADSVRLYFLRFEQKDVPTEQVMVNGKLAEGCKWFNASPEFTQATVAMVPAKNFKRDENFIFSAEDIISNNLLLTLLPGTAGEGTGLNPPPGSDDPNP
jgi:hypothetical protein